jgi:hypothetical protein
MVAEPEGVKRFSEPVVPHEFRAGCGDRPRGREWDCDVCRLAEEVHPVGGVLAKGGDVADLSAGERQAGIVQRDAHPLTLRDGDYLVASG